MATGETAAAGIIDASAIVVGAVAGDRDEAIDRVGEILLRRGVVTQAYVDAMHAREQIISTYLGNGIALPHGTSEAQDDVLATGIAVVQFPAGVPWGEENAYLVIGLAARSEEHIGVMSRLAGVLADAELCARLGSTADAVEIHTVLTSDAVPPAPRTPSRQDEVTKTVRIVNPSGLHARPAAEIVEKVGEFDADVTISAGERQASAFSITQVIALGASVGDEVTVRATGDEAHAALGVVLEVLLSGDGR